MQKAIYCMKMTIFLPQLHDLHFAHSDEIGIRRMALLVTLVYAKYWHEAVVSVYAPSNDHQLAGVLKRYSDRVPADPALNACGTCPKISLDWPSSMIALKTVPRRKWWPTF